MSNQYDNPHFRDLAKKMVEAGETGDWHIRVESDNDPTANMATLAPEGPYAYSLHRTQPVGNISGRLSVITSYDAIHDYYKDLHGRTDVVDWHQISQIRGPWYGFQHGIGDLRDRASGKMNHVENVVLLPTFGTPGITGELFWYRYVDINNKVDPECGPVARTKTLERHNRLLDAFRAEDIEGIVAAFTEHCQTAICDYVTESGTLVALDGREPLRAYYTALFDKFHVRSVELVQRLVEDWFVFCELLWTLEPKTGGGLVGCSTAEFAALAPDGRLISRIGHGTATTPV